MMLFIRNYTFFIYLKLRFNKRLNMPILNRITILSLSFVCLQILSTSNICSAKDQKVETPIFESNDPTKKLPPKTEQQQNYSISYRFKVKLNQRLNQLIGPRDAALLASPQGKLILSRHRQNLLIPASTLKVLTALIAINHLGLDYRFATDFYVDTDHNLKIKGYGDPLMVSERLAEIARQLTRHITYVQDIIIDDSYFDNTIVIPGKNKSLQPYDAPNGALCVNFNTVAFKKIYNRYVSAEKQTPLLPFALTKAKSSGLKQGRIMLVGKKDESLLYAGELIQYFLKQAGIQVTGKIRRGRINQNADKLILHYLSQFNLAEVIARLMKFSNNFIANQLFLTAGAVVFGPPATLVKGVDVTDAFVHNQLGLQDVTVVEGSGLSIKNRISAESMLTVLNRFRPFYTLLRREKKEYFKTGTLSDVKARVGFLEDNLGRHFAFVVLLNTPGKTTKQIMRLFKETVALIK
jgi:serine-type D-Ala-D-Ala carboxypeptidase/endopeptidase (penicillin-binding protein 4)